MRNHVWEQWNTFMCREICSVRSVARPLLAPPVFVALSIGKVSTVICRERWWKAAGRSFLWLWPLCFPSRSRWAVVDPHSDTAERLALRQEHYHSFLQRRAFLEYVKREIASSTKRRLVSAVNGGLRAAAYGDTTEKHTMAHWNISSFQHSCSQQTAQYEQHCAPWQKMKGVSLRSEEAHNAVVSIARHNRQRSISSLFRHLKSLMQIDNRHSRCFRTEAKGAHVCPRGFICQTRWSIFFKGSQMEGGCKNVREKAELKQSHPGFLGGIALMPAMLLCCML